MSVHPYQHPVALDRDRGTKRGPNLVARFVLEAGGPRGYFTKGPGKVRRSRRTGRKVKGKKGGRQRDFERAVGAACRKQPAAAALILGVARANRKKKGRKRGA